MKERGELPNEEGDVVKEYKAMHEEDFWTSWLREDERGKEERMAKAARNEEEKGEKRKRQEEKEENETVTVKRRCEGLESCGDLSWEDLLDKPAEMSDRETVSCELVRVVPDVTDVPVSPSSVVTEFCDVSSMCSDREFEEPQFFSFSKKHAHCCTDTQEEMWYEGSPVKAHPLSRRWMIPPTLMQNSYTSFEREQGSYEEEGQGWNAR